LSPGVETDKGLETVFEAIYKNVLFSSTALDKPEGQAIRNCLFEFNELPANLNSLIAVLANSRSDTRMVAAVALRNPAVAAKILKVVNSSYIGLRGKVTSLKRAITLLGYTNIRGLILGMSVFSKLKPGMLPADVPLGQLWRHSSAVSQIGAILAERLKDIDGTTLISGGLLHDAGKLVMGSAFKERYAHVVRAAGDLKGDFVELQLKTFGLTHPIVGAALCHSWNLPERLWGLIAAQEHPALGPDLRTAAALKLAEFFARSHGIGLDGQWAHGFVPEDICWYLEISAKEAADLIQPADIRRVVESTNMLSSWE
jgi:two-component system cell cycle response regulator